MSNMTRWKLGDGLIPSSFGGISDIVNAVLGQVSELGPEWLLERGGMQPLDMEVNDGEVIVKFPMPGCKSDELTVEVLNDVLTVRGERRKESFDDDRDHDYIRRERVIQDYQESVKLPVKVLGKETTATYEDGVLEVTLPREQAGNDQAHRITVK